MIAFWILGVFLIASAVWTVTASKPVYSVIGLLANFLCLATLYLTLSAEFIAVIQVIVYAGAILVLFAFVITLLSSGVAAFAAGPDRLPKIGVPAVVAVLVGLGFLVYGIGRSTLLPSGPSASGSVAGAVGDAGVFGSIADFGRSLFTTDLLAFEITALVLMVAVIGVVLLAGEGLSSLPTAKRAREARKDMREAIVRGGESS